jgi:hypothetical protein
LANDQFLLRPLSQRCITVSQFALCIGTLNLAFYLVFVNFTAFDFQRHHFCRHTFSQLMLVIEALVVSFVALC